MQACARCVQALTANMTLVGGHDAGLGKEIPTPVVPCKHGLPAMQSGMTCTLPAPRLLREGAQHKHIFLLYSIHIVCILSLYAAIWPKAPAPRLLREGVTGEGKHSTTQDLVGARSLQGAPCPLTQPCHLHVSKHSYRAGP